MSRYSPKETKYKNKRMVMLNDLTYDMIFLNRHPDADEDFPWWPVGVLVLTDDLTLQYGEKIYDYKYLICIYQAIEPELVAWGMATNKIVDVSALRQVIIIHTNPFIGGVSPAIIF